METAIFWFRRDLRLDDNPALHAAMKRAPVIIPVYIHDPEAEGDWAPGGASRWWLHESLTHLSRELEMRGSRLILRRGPSLDVLETLLGETGAEAVFWNRLYEPDLVARDRGVKTALRGMGIHAESHRAGLLCEPWELATGSGEAYRVFTPYWRALRSRTAIPAPAGEPRALPAPPRWPASRRVAELELVPPRAGWHHKLAAYWQPGEAGGRGRLNHFLAGIMPDYAQGRDFPGIDGVSALSPHLHFGELGPARVWSRVREHLEIDPQARAGAEAWLRELGWREFAHHVLFHFPETPDQPLYRRWRHFPWREDYLPQLRAWRRGETGVPIVDAAMRQLWETGWMHNRLRMIVASWLVKNLRVPWQEGARWFWDTLVDADLANNTLGWQWSAGCGADAAPYFRIFNPFTQSRRFDPRGIFLRRWLPELAELPDRHIHAPHDAPAAVLAAAGVRPGRDYPRPMVDYRASRQQALAAAEQVRGR